MSYNADDCPDSGDTVGAGGGSTTAAGGGTTGELNCATPTSPGMTRQDAVVMHGDGGSIDGGDPATIPSMAGYEPCDPLIILNLFQSLSATTNSLELQMKINLHVSGHPRRGHRGGRFRFLFYVVVSLFFLVSHAKRIGAKIGRHG
uniref:Uncharacterized protein n=1 Tax=Anopheles culicifacies TaxID=139723 RepID=A0A182M9W2_9DIPT